MSTPFTDTTVVSEVDPNHPWFEETLAERVPLPGDRRAQAPTNVLSSAQVGVVIRGLQSDPNTASLPIAEACDIARSRRMANLRGMQHDFDVVDYFARREQAANADEPLTGSQENMVSVYIKAMVGIENHWNATVQAAIDKLDDVRKDQYVDRLDQAQTQGELAKVMKSLERFVPNPATVRAAEQSAASAITANLDISDDDEEVF